MYYIAIKTKYNKIKLMLEDNDFYDENLQLLMQQPYVQGIYLRWVTEKEYQRNPEYNKVKKLERKKQ